MKRTLTIVALALAAALTVAACGNDTNSGSTSGAAFNDADVTFAQSMIPHHEQALEMAKLGQQRAADPQVKQLADKIVAAQGPEIETMTGLLQDWGKDVSGGGMGGMSGMGQSSGNMSGMMSGADMKRLEAASGAEFDRMFLTMMTRHHTSAIEMAKTEQQDGKNPEALALAEKIVADQTAEIAEMEKLLKS